MTKDKPELAIEMTEWYEVQVSYTGENEWSNAASQTFDSAERARKYLAYAGAGSPPRFEYRVVRIVQHVFDVGQS